MIGGLFHQGSGLGNQIFRYITTRSLAEDLGTDFCMLYRQDGSGKEEGFKGQSFMDIDLGKDPMELLKGHRKFEEKKVVLDGVDVRSYDPEINFIKDNTFIDGEFQDQRYWGHHLKDIDNWLKTEPLEVPDDTCIIGFRGGEYYAVPDLGLPKEYFDKAIQMMIEEGVTKFEVHTDDVNLAQRFFPEYECIHDIGYNWRSMRYAKNTIIANSSFFIIPRLLKHMEDVEAVTLSPRGWARRNLSKGDNAGDFLWALPSNYYPQFRYI